MRVVSYPSLLFADLCAEYLTRFWLTACPKVCSLLFFARTCSFNRLPVYFNFKQHQISPSEYLPQWLVPLFADHLPLDACARVWDGIVLHGDAFLFRAALAILASLEQRLFFPERRELMEVLRCALPQLFFRLSLMSFHRGENRAAQEVARRAAGTDIDWEGLGKYAQYGLDEESVWGRIVEMDDWWKEKTWNRLIQRELPDI